jgi:hypothetical protein
VSTASAFEDRAADAEAFEADIRAILSGEKSYELEATAPQPAAPSSPNPTPAPTQTAPVSQAISHSIFDQMASVDANTLDVGALSLEQQFSEFDRIFESQNRPLYLAEQSGGLKVQSKTEKKSEHASSKNESGIQKQDMSITDEHFKDIRSTNKKFPTIEVESILEVPNILRVVKSIEIFDKYLVSWDEFYKLKEKELNVIKRDYNKHGEEIKKRFEPIADNEERLSIIKSSNLPGQTLVGLVDQRNLLQAMGTYEIKTHPSEGKYLYVHELASAPWNVWYDDKQNPYSCSGAGTELIKEFIHISRKNGGYGRIRLSAWGSSPPFYEKLGFKKLSINSTDGGSHELTSQAAEKLSPTAPSNFPPLNAWSINPIAESQNPKFAEELIPESSPRVNQESGKRPLPNPPSSNSSNSPPAPGSSTANRNSRPLPSPPQKQLSKGSGQK